MDCSKRWRGKTYILKGTNPLIAEENHKNHEIHAGVVRKLSLDLSYELCPIV